jgi:hypothetical protein
VSNGSHTSPLQDAAAVTEAVAELGLLFLSDPKRRNAIEIVTGQFPRGSWWSHPRANDIYDILMSVEQHPDVLMAKLLSGKVTLVHRALWPALLTIVTAREPWQTDGLPPIAARWLASFDEAEAAGADVPAVSRTVSKEIEARLLAFAESVHTSGGKHETRLHTWRSWAARVSQPWPATAPTPAAVAEAKRALEAAATRLGPPTPDFPWARLTAAS